MRASYLASPQFEMRCLFPEAARLHPVFTNTRLEHGLEAPRHHTTRLHDSQTLSAKLKLTRTYQIDITSIGSGKTLHKVI